jgi:hypothetical protein
MRKVLSASLAVVVACLGMPVGIYADAPARTAAKPKVSVRQGPTTGGLEGVAKNASQQNLPGMKVQVRAPNGELVATGTTNAQGAFSFPSLNAGKYTIEIVDGAGNIVGTSASTAVTAGTTSSITVTAAGAGTLGAAGAAGLGGFFGLGSIGTVAVIVGGTLGIIAFKATRNDSSPSR